MKILVTGGAGYIGSVLVRQLLNKGFRVRVIDSLKFGGEALYDVMLHPAFEFMLGDIRDAEVVRKAVDGIDAVAHLAAIVGDPACKKYSDEAKQTNWEGSVSLFNEAEKAGCKRFVFASTCSNYGKMPDPDSFVTETSALNPISLYAELKVKFEKFLLEEKSFEKIQVHLPGEFVSIDEQGPGSCVTNGIQRGNKGDVLSNNQVAFFNSFY